MAECATDRRAVLPCDTRSRAGEAARLDRGLRAGDAAADYVNYFSQSCGFWRRVGIHMLNAHLDKPSFAVGAAAIHHRTEGIRDKDKTALAVRISASVLTITCRLATAGNVAKDLVAHLHSPLMRGLPAHRNTDLWRDGRAPVRRQSVHHSYHLPTGYCCA